MTALTREKVDPRGQVEVRVAEAHALSSARPSARAHATVRRRGAFRGAGRAIPGRRMRRAPKNTRRARPCRKASARKMGSGAIRNNRYRGLPATCGRPRRATPRFTTVKISRTARGREPARRARAAAWPVAHDRERDRGPGQDPHEGVDRLPIAGVVAHQHRPVVGDHRPDLLGEPGGRDRRFSPAAAPGIRYWNEPHALPGVPEEARARSRAPSPRPARRARARPAPSRTGPGPAPTAARWMTARMWHQKARPSSRPASERAASRGRSSSTAQRSGQPQGPRAEGQDLDVVPVVAEAVAGDEGGGERSVEARASDRGARARRRAGPGGRRRPRRAR